MEPTKTEESVVKSADTKKINPKVILASNKSRKVVALIVVAVLLAISWFAYNALRPAVTVSGFDTTYKVSQKTYKALKAQALAGDISSDSVVQDTIKKAYTYKIVAAHLKLTPNDDEIANAAIASGVKDLNKLTDWDRLNGYISAVDNKVIFSEKGGYIGTVLFYPYDRHYVFSDQGVPKPEHFGEASYIADDKRYALEAANADHDALVKGTTTVEKIMKRIQNDTRLQFATASNDSYSFKADLNGLEHRAGNTTTFSISNYVVDAAKSLGKAGVSPVGQITHELPAFEMAPGYPPTIDVAYYIVNLTDTSQPNPKLAKDFNNALQQVKVTQHVH